MVTYQLTQLTLGYYYWLAPWPPLGVCQWGWSLVYIVPEDVEDVAFISVLIINGEKLCDIMM